MSEIHPAVAAYLAKTPTYSDAWTMLAGYVAAIVAEGSKDAADILTYMHELKPVTKVLTGTVKELQQGETQ